MNGSLRLPALVVEPQPSLLPVICKVATLAGFDVTATREIPRDVSSGVDLVLVDVVNGASRNALFDFASAYKKLGATVGLMTTAMVRLEDRIEPQTPYDFALLKPFLPEHLLEAWKRAKASLQKTSDDADAVYI